VSTYPGKCVTKVKYLGVWVGAGHGQFANDWYIRQKKIIVHLPEGMLIIFSHYVSDSNMSLTMCDRFKFILGQK